MTHLISKKALGLVAMGLAAWVPLASAQADPAGQGRLVTAIQTYQGATNEGRAMAARELRRALAAGKSAPAATRAEATFLLSDYAMRERKKDLALKQAEEGLKLLGGLQAGEAAAVRALGARVKAQALLAKQERLAALKLMVDARLAYGAQKPQANAKWDKVWDELFLWVYIAYAELRGSEKKEGTDLLNARQAEFDLIGKMEGSCENQNDPLIIVNRESNLPAYPIAPMFAGQAGGVFMRLSLNPEGGVTQATATAFSTSEDFAILAERAAANWVATGKGLEQPACRAERPALVVFKY